NAESHLFEALAAAGSGTPQVVRYWLVGGAPPVRGANWGWVALPRCAIRSGIPTRKSPAASIFGRGGISAPSTRSQAMDGWQTQLLASPAVDVAARLKLTVLLP